MMARGDPPYRPRRDAVDHFLSALSPGALAGHARPAEQGPRGVERGHLDGHLEAQNFGLDELPPRDARYDIADEVVEACFELWEGWDADALVLDKERGVFADPSKVHYANYRAAGSRRAGR